MKLPNLTGKCIGKYKVGKHIDSGGFGVTYQATDTTMDKIVAIKFLTTENDSKWHEEAKKAAKLSGAPQIATVIEFNQEHVKSGNKDFQLKYIVWEFVKGETLEKFLSKSSLTTTAILHLTTEICLGIAAIKEAKLEHGDLHPKNIMIVDPPSYDPFENYKIKILDFGLARSFRGQFTDDMEYLRQILLQCWHQNQKYIEQKIPADKKFQSLLSDLINRLEDPNLERRLTDPADVIKRIHSIQQQSSMEIKKQEEKLETPFDYTSAEEMPENSDLLNYLYTDNVPWLKEITNYGTTIISGPRGSGKSMILKNMRLLTKISSLKFNASVLSDIKFLGFYIHCHQNLYIPFSGSLTNYQSTETKERFIHYLNLLYTSEIIETLNVLEQQKILLISPLTKRNIMKFLDSNIFQQQTTLKLVSNETILNHLKSMIEKEILLAQQRIIENKKIQKQSRVGYLYNFIIFLSNEFEFFSSKPIYFLLDDYSNPKIPNELQKSINRIIGYRNNRFWFKITTERFGFFPEDSDGKTLQIDREYTYVDLGGKYIKYDKPEKKEFIKEIIQRRLERAGIDLTPDQFFGTRKYESIAAALRLEKKGKKRKSTRVRYSGFDTIYRLCMGDIGTILTLCKEIYSLAKSKHKILTVEIEEAVQDKQIRDFSKRRLDMIKEMPQYGEKLFHLVEIFGEISKKYLYEYTKAKSRSEFLEVLRLDIMENDRCLDDDARLLLQRLIAEHIFIDAGTAYPWGKGISNVQLVLRPIYTPVLKISYANRYAIHLTCKKLNDFLTNPDAFAKNKYHVIVKDDGEKIDDEIMSLDQFNDGIPNGN